MELNWGTSDWLEKQTILLVDAGSTAYGTQLPTSDRDVKGICIPPIQYQLGLQTFEQYQPTGDNSRVNTEADTDITIYSLKKFMQLALNANPNVLEMLFTDEENILTCSPAGRTLLANRELFLSKQLIKSFGGFAIQLGKRLEKGLKQREELVNAYGYDTKTLMHAIRIYQMGIECLQTGTFTTKRPNATELIRVRQGRLTKEEGMTLLQMLEEAFQQAAAESTLPQKPNFKQAEALLIQLTQDALKGN